MAREVLNLEGVRIIWRNFKGKESAFNRRGDRNFCVVLTQEIADQLKADGWNVKTKPARDEYEEPLYYLTVAVNYNNIPPRVYLISSGKKQLLNEDTVGLVDDVEIETCDLVLSPYHWTVNGKSGIKAYLKTAYIVMVEDKFASKYNQVDYEIDEDGEMPF